MKEQTRVLFYLFVTAVVVASCSERPSPMAPTPSDIQPALSVATSGCPSVEELSAELRPIVTQACPPDGTYRNNGERNKCRKDAFDKAIKPYKQCFTNGQINEIRRSVLRVTPGQHGKSGTDEIQQEPISSQ